MAEKIEKTYYTAAYATMNAQFFAENTANILSLTIVLDDEMKRLAPLKHGDLRDSISTNIKVSFIDMNNVLVKLDVEILSYGIYLEFGTNKIRPIPFIRPAFLNYEEELKQYNFEINTGAEGITDVIFADTQIKPKVDKASNFVVILDTLDDIFYAYLARGVIKV